jgi:hypothetical protein
MFQKRSKISRNISNSIESTFHAGALKAPYFVQGEVLLDYNVDKKGKF